MRRVGDVTVDESTGSFYDLRVYTDQHVHMPFFINSSCLEGTGRTSCMDTKHNDLFVSG
jgi:hypothetical protein